MGFNAEDTSSSRHLWHGAKYEVGTVYHLVNKNIFNSTYAYARMLDKYNVWPSKPSTLLPSFLPIFVSQQSP